MTEQKFILRKLTKADIPACIQLFFETVHTVNSKDYTPQQLDAWAPKNVAILSHWQTLSENFAYVIVANEDILGFADLEKTGYLDRLFIHKDWQRHGLATILLKKLETIAQAQGIKKIFTKASITAQPFFLKNNFIVDEIQAKEIRGQILTNYKMHKEL